MHARLTRPLSLTVLGATLLLAACRAAPDAEEEASVLVLDRATAPFGEQRVGTRSGE